MVTQLFMNNDVILLLELHSNLTKVIAVVFISMTIELSQ